jgi:heat shock 70kDa protein 1/2/6/8
LVDRLFLRSYSLIISNFSDTKRLIGRRFTDSLVQADMKLWPFRVIQGLSDTPKISVSYKGKKLQLAAEEISSMILDKMKKLLNFTSEKL